MSNNNKAKTINKVVKSLKPYNPEKVILFGSYAWGRPTKDSDIDLFIVKNTKKTSIKEYRRQDHIYTK